MADEKKPSVLIIDDGTSDRMVKTEMYALLVQSYGGIAARTKLQDIDKEKLGGYDIILTDLDGKGAGSGVNSPDHERFLSLLNEAVEKGATPVVRMFSGRFAGQGDINLAQFPALQNIITTHTSTNAASNPEYKGVIELAIEAVKNRTATTADEFSAPLEPVRIVQPPKPAAAPTVKLRPLDSWTAEAANRDDKSREPGA